jgi:uncharacterized membrane protein
MTSLREARLEKEPRTIDGFRLRGADVTRLESFSDAVFGFALTLLVVSLDVPKSFEELINTMRGFPAFALCFVLLVLIWNRHYVFCRRYGLDDLTTRTLTCVLLFLVLFYVYPLKFLFNFSFNNLIFGGSTSAIRLTVPQVSLLLGIYGLGFAAVYVALTALHLHAWRLREQLGLNELEKFDTRQQIFRLSLLIAIGLIAAALAQFRSTLNWSGFCYLLLLPILRTHSVMRRRRRKAFHSKPQSE